MSDRVIVLKFGGSVLTGEADVRRAVNEVYRFHRRGFSVVAVVSAFHGATDRLLALGRASSADDSRLAELLVSGERDAARALSSAFARHGIPARLLDPLAISLTTIGARFDADPVGLDDAPLRDALSRGNVAIVPGFFGACESGGVALLGRGGSDLSALFVASRLSARCRLVKDVPALFEWDPAAPGPIRPRAYDEVTFGTAQRIGGRVLQAKAIAFAQRHELHFEIGDWNSASSTTVGAHRDRFRGCAPRRPLRVALLGCGAVGSAVRDALDAARESFDLTHVLVRDRSRHAGDDRVTTDAEQVLGAPIDVAVEALGGVEPAFSFVSSLLARGVCVVTANKSLVAARCDELATIARTSGARLLASACVGGAVPVLETTNRLATRLRRIEGVINGTSAFIADRLSRGRTLTQALDVARRHGLAEADATRDLSGGDAAEKLAVLAHVLGVSIEAGAPETTGFAPDELEARAREARKRGATLAQVAVLEREGDAWHAHVEWRELGGRVAAMFGAPSFASADRGEPWARRARSLAVARATNKVVFETEDGRRVELHGIGAGGVPTATAIVADLLDLARQFDPNSVADEDFPGDPTGPRRPSLAVAAESRTAAARCRSGGVSTRPPWLD